MKITPPVLPSAYIVSKWKTVINISLVFFQVVQSLKFQTSSKNYSELGSCPTLNTGSRPLLARGLTDGTNADASIHEETIQTSKGSILVARQGDPRKPALITYHDLGLNHKTNFLVSIILDVLQLFGLAIDY